MSWRQQLGDTLNPCMAQRRGFFFAVSLFLLAVSAAAQQETKPVGQPALTAYARGKIASLSPSCSSFTIKDGRYTKGPTLTLSLDATASQWSAAPEGCSFVSIAGNTVLVKRDTAIRVQYVTRGAENVVTWVAVDGRKACAGQGGAARTPDTVFFIGCDGISFPAPEYCPNPPGPPTAAPGTVLLEVLIAPDGTVADVLLVRGWSRDIDAGAIRTVRTWRFKPLTDRDGTAVWARSPVEISFAPW